MNFLLKNSAPAFFALLTFAACSNRAGHTNGTVIIVSLTRDSTALLVKGLDHELIMGLRADSGVAKAWQSLVTVFKETKDEDLQGLEPVYPGVYRTSGDLLIFKPDSGFVKNNTYRAEVNIPDSFSKDALLGKDEPPGNVKPREFRFVFK